MEEDYTQKYLKYKNKYLELKKKLDKKAMSGGGGKVDIMLFKADWCGHCKNFKPTWDAVSSAYKNKYNFITYDADKQREVFEKYKVDGFPTVLVKQGDNIIPFDGERSFEDLSNFVNRF